MRALTLPLTTVATASVFRSLPPSDTFVLRLREFYLAEQDIELRDTVHDHFEMVGIHDDPVEQLVREYSARRCSSSRAPLCRGPRTQTLRPE